MTQFGSTVLALAPTKDKRKKLDEKWHYGAWVGKTENSDENIVLTENGAMLARTVRVLNDDVAKEMQYHLRVRGLPWDSKELGSKVEVDVKNDDEKEVPSLPKGTPQAQQLPAAVQVEATCPACRGRHRAHTQQAGCRPYKQAKAKNEKRRTSPCRAAVPQRAKRSREQPRS